MKSILSLSALLLVGCVLQAQENKKQWSLDECIQHALEHNVELKQIEQTRESRKIDLNTSRNSWLPDLNANIGQNFDFGRSPSKTGVIVDQNSANTSAYLQLSMPIFDGLKIPNDIAARKLDLQAATEALNKAREDLSVQITSSYLQTLYNKEVMAIALLQTELCREQVTRTQALVSSGKVPHSQLYDIKAQLAKDEVTFTEARNNVALSLLDLMQNMELNDPLFDVSTPDTTDALNKYMGSILPPDAIYNQAVALKPQIKEQTYLLESQHKMLRVAQSGYYPKLNLNASYSNGYYRYSGDEAVNIPFQDQIRQNERKTIGLSLSIPIFNRFQVHNQVRTARVAILSRELAMENSKKLLYKEIQQAFLNATAAQEKYTASEKSVRASQEAFTYAQERYNAGRSSVFEYNEAKTKYAQSLLEQSQAKYNFILRAKILDFYHGIPLTL